MYIARFILQNKTPLHCGGGSDPSLDQPVNRDSYGLWKIQGSSVAGILRSYVRDAEPKQEDILFGHHNATKTNSSNSTVDQSASLVWCSDALLLDFDENYAFKKIASGNDIGFSVGPFVRDHVNIDLEKGTATDGGKYDEEIVPPGVKFAIELKLDGWNEEISADKSDAFLKLCSAIKQGLITFGGKTVSGYGKVKCTYAEVKELTSKDDSLYTGKLILPLVSNGPILVGGTNTKDSEVDMVCLMTPILDEKKKDYIYKYTIPGSSLRGVIRHRVFDILKALDKDNDKNDELNRIFGSVSGKNGSTGHVKCSDIYLDIDKSQHVQHVAIDRFTGGAIDGALFDEAPIWESGLLLKTEIEFTDLNALQTAVLMHALLDICTGDAPIGGGTNRGNGVVRIKDLDKGILTALQNVEAKVSRGKEILDVKDQAQLNQWLDDLDGELIK